MSDRRSTKQHVGAFLRKTNALTANSGCFLPVYSHPDTDKGPFVGYDTSVDNVGLMIGDSRITPRSCHCDILPALWDIIRAMGLIKWTVGFIKWSTLIIQWTV